VERLGRTAILRLALVAPLAFLCALGAAAAASGPPQARLPSVAVAPALDGDAGWGNAAHVATAWDFTHGHPADEPADVAFVTDAKSLFVRFTVHQRETITATQAVDGVGENSDDTVTVRLWAGGVSGIAYDFRATPRGTRYQASTENNNYAPAWVALARPTATGYVVTMRIPFSAIRGTGAGTWRVQFERDIKANNERDEWASAPGQSSSDQVVDAGLVDGFDAGSKAARAKARVGLYALGQAGATAYGGDTSRLGADVAIPVTPTASLVATFHPDFSNVETDQQTITPTTFTRFYPELRPFFAQGAAFYDHTSCYECPGAGYHELYTTAIPTPRSGYQLEGTQGPVAFGALDAIGFGRIDQAQSVTYTTPSNVFAANYTRVASNQTALTDTVNFGSVQFNDQRGLLGYIEAANESGTAVTSGSAAQRWDGGIQYLTANDNLQFSMRRVGSQWNPVDGYTPVNDIAGYSSQGFHTFHFSGGLQSLSFGSTLDHYAGSDGLGTNLQDFQQLTTFTFKDQVDVRVFTGSQFYRPPFVAVLYPDNQQGVNVDYFLGTPLQSTLSYNFGSYGTGRLASTDRLAAFRIARRVTLAVEAYDTRWTGGTVAQQWLERATATIDVDHATSATIGLRRIVGTPPPYPGLLPPSYAGTTNLSFALSRRRPHDDIFLVYGNPDAPYTQNAVILKYVHYFGAERGT
jgi:hypothetical protein